MTPSTQLGALLPFFGGGFPKVDYSKKRRVPTDSNLSNQVARTELRLCLDGLFLAKSTPHMVPCYGWCFRGSILPEPVRTEPRRRGRCPRPRSRGSRSARRRGGALEIGAARAERAVLLLPIGLRICVGQRNRPEKKRQNVDPGFAATAMLLLFSSGQFAEMSMFSFALLVLKGI